MKSKHRNHNETGFVLVGMIFMMVLAALVALQINRTAGMNSRISSNRAKSIQTYFGQLAAMEEARWQLEQDLTWRIGPAPEDFVYDGITYKRTVQNCAITGYETAVTISVTAPGAAKPMITHVKWELMDRSTGAFYITDTYNHRIRRVDNQAGIVTTIAGTGVGGFSGDGGPAIDARLWYPRFICGDRAGNIYVADDHNHRIRKIDAETGNISTLAGNGSCGYSGDGDSAVNATLCYPNAVWVNSKNDIYIGDEQNDCIRKIDAETGDIITVAGTGTEGFSGDGGPATSAQLYFRWDVGLWVDDNENIYIADNGNHRIRKVDGTTGNISTVAGTGTAGYSGDGGSATSAQLNRPNGVWVDDDENIYIADEANHRIRKVDKTSGNISTVAGNGTAGFSGDGGLAVNAQLNRPFFAWTDAGGDLYIADMQNHRIRKVDNHSGIITTVAGTGAGGFSGDGGPALSAQFNGPRSVQMQIKGGSTQYGWEVVRELY